MKNPLSFFCALFFLLFLLSSAAGQNKKKRLPFSFPPAEKSGTYTSEELKGLDRALSNLNMTRKDLEFNKDHAPSRYTLPLVLHLLKKPLDNPIYADLFVRALESEKSLGKRISLCFQQLGAEPLSIKDWDKGEENSQKWKTPEWTRWLIHMTGKKEVDPELVKRIHAFPLPLKTLLLDFHSTLAQAYTSLFEAFKDLSVEEQKFLRDTAPILVLKEGDYRLQNRPEFAKILARYRGNPTEALLDLPKRVNFSKLAKSARLVADFSFRTKDDLSKISCEEWKKVAILHHPGVTGPITLFLKTRYGRLLLGGPGDNIYTQKVEALFEPAGQDIYRSSFGGAGLNSSLISLLVDLKGDDLYQTKAPVSFGAAIMGVGILLDCDGDDTYRGKSISQGSAIFGVGALVDERGNDSYRGEVLCQGSAIFGLGLLIENQPPKDRQEGLGNDRYHAALLSQGSSQTLGFGLLLDSYGNDVYYAGGTHMHRPLYNDRYQSLSQGFSIGMRGHRAAGGIAFLIDKQGNDRYLGEVYGQGAAYWYGAGFLVDQGGNDSYNLTIYGQGSGIHLAVGTLIDEGGNDSYTMDEGLGQGGAHDFAVGILLDRGGKDRYTATSGCQGVGLTNSVGILIDREGDDLYCGLKDHLQGAGRPARGAGSIGILVDLAGKDRYSHGGTNGSQWTGTQYGTGIDIPTPEKKDPSPKKTPGTGTGTGTTAMAHTEENFNRLFKIASLWEVGTNKERVPKARKELISWGKDALPFMPREMEKYSGLHIRALDALIVGLAKNYPKEVETLILKTFQSQSRAAMVNGLRLSGQLKIKAAGPYVVRLIRDPYLSRYACPIAGDLKLKEAVPLLLLILQKGDEMPIITGLEALSKIGDPGSLPGFLKMLEHHYFTVRYGAANRLPRFGKAAIKPLVNLMENKKKRPTIRIHALQTLTRFNPEFKDLKLLGRVLPHLEDPNPVIRAWTVKLLVSFSKNLRPLTILKELQKKEKDPFVRGVLEEELERRESKK